MIEAKKKESFKLSEINQKILDVLHSSFASPIWVVAEISEIKVNSTGHCYLELIEKSEKDDTLLARSRATIWSRTYRMLQPYFETSTGYELVPGIKIMVNARIEFHKLYGLSLNILDIEPAYTLGDQERRRQEIINRLSSEGVIDMNRELSLPLVPQKIAIISSESAAGYGDFINQLENNSHGYRFYCKLFSASMQGEHAEASIIEALDRIYEYEDFFDLVVIIRGGGSKTDLGWFDNYQIAYHITQFPLPILTGIGHEQDDTISDMVANMRLKTPTAVADFLINRLAEFAGILDERREELLSMLSRIITENKLKLQLLEQKFSASSTALLKKERESYSRIGEKLRHITEKLLIIKTQENKSIIERIKNLVRMMNEHGKTANAGYSDRLGQLIKNYLFEKSRDIESFERIISYMDPSRILNLGYSITRHQGKLLKSHKDAKPEDELETILADGFIKSKVSASGGTTDQKN